MKIIKNGQGKELVEITTVRYIEVEDLKIYKKGLEYHDWEVSDIAAEIVEGIESYLDQTVEEDIDQLYKYGVNNG